MQLFVLTMVFGIFAHDLKVYGPSVANAVQSVASVSTGWILVLVILPKLAMVAIYFGACLITRRQPGRRSGTRALRWLERLTGT